AGTRTVARYSARPRWRIFWPPPECRCSRAPCLDLPGGAKRPFDPYAPGWRAAYYGGSATRRLAARFETARPAAGLLRTESRCIRCRGTQLLRALRDGIQRAIDAAERQSGGGDVHAYHPRIRYRTACACR